MRSLVMICICVFLSTLYVGNTSAQMMCIQGGQPPAACPEEGQYRWDNTICAWICNPITTQTLTPTPAPGRVCRQGGSRPAECPLEGQSEWDNTICAFVCKKCDRDAAVRIDCSSDSLGLSAVWNQTACRYECPTKCPNGSAFRDCQTSGCSTMRCMAGTTCRNDRCVSGSNKCIGTCVPNPTSPPPPPTVAPTQCAFGTTVQELRTSANFEISSPKVEHTAESAASLFPSSQAQLLGGIDGFSTLTDLFSFVESGKIYQENVMYKPTSEMYVLYTYSAGENNHGWINPASESYRVVRIGDESMYECRVQKASPVNCLINPCDNAVRAGACTREACIADYSIGCNFICTTPAPTTTKPATTPEPRMCIQGGPRPAACPGEGESVWDNTMCAFVCKPTPEPPVCASCAVMLCLTGTTCIENNGCGTCSIGTVVLTASFTIRWYGYGVQKATKINEALSIIAKIAGVRDSFVIHNADIQQVSKFEYGYQRWSIKVGFKGDTHADRKFALNEFFNILNQLQKVKDVKINAANSALGFTTEEETFTTQTETMTMQTCGDGSEIKVEQQCPIVDDLIVPTTSSSSSSTPIAVIIAPIVALVTAIATAAIIIIRRRRLNTIKTMDRMETEMTNNPAITSQV